MDEQPLACGFRFQTSRAATVVAVLVAISVLNEQSPMRDWAMYGRPIFWGWPFIFRADNTAPDYFPRFSGLALVCDVAVGASLVIAAHSAVVHWYRNQASRRFGLRATLVALTLVSMLFAFALAERAAWKDWRVWDDRGPTWRRLELLSDDNWRLVLRRPLSDLSRLTGLGVMFGAASIVWKIGACRKRCIRAAE